MANRQVFGLSFCATPSIYAIKIGLQTPLTVTKPSDCADESFQKKKPALYVSRAWQKEISLQHDDINQSKTKEYSKSLRKAANPQLHYISP